MFDSYKAGKQIVLLRKSRGITQEELAQRLSVSPQAVYRLMQTLNMYYYHMRKLRIFPEADGQEAWRDLQSWQQLSY